MVARLMADSNLWYLAMPPFLPPDLNRNRLAQRRDPGFK